MAEMTAAKAAAAEEKARFEAEEKKSEEASEKG